MSGIIVGNKNDLSEFVDVPMKDCKNFATEYKLDYFDVSARTNAGIIDPLIH